MSDDVPMVGPDDTVHGHGAIERLPELVHATRAERVLLVCGRTSFEASGAARMLPALEHVTEVRRWDEHSANPTAHDVAVGLRAAASHRPDLVLGVGGGSTLDVAKVVAALHGHVAGDDLGAVIATVRSQHVGTVRDVGLVLAPTTSGSGAQATHFGTVYVDDVKHSVAGPALLPDTIVLDPDLALSGSAYQRACSGLDALAQAIESLWAVGADERSRLAAREGLELLLPALVPFIESPDAVSADAMARGSQLAGEAINRSRTTLPHALSYALTQHAGLPHGHAVAHTLPAVLRRHLDADATSLTRVRADAHRRSMDTLVDVMGGGDAQASLIRLEEVVRRLGLRDPERSQHAAIVEQVDLLAASVDPARSGNNPVGFTTADLRAILLEGVAAGRATR